MGFNTAFFSTFNFCSEKQEGWNVVELSKVLGVYRSDFLYKEHRMLKLPISNSSYGADFLDNVHCT